MTRMQYIEQIRRLIYGGQPTDDAEITIGLVNQWLNQGIGVAAQKNYRDNTQLDGIGYVNNSFYSTFSGLAITGGSNFRWQMTLPQVPIGIGATDGIGTVTILDSKGRETLELILLSENQKSFYRTMRPVQNKVIGYYEGRTLYAISTEILSEYTGKVTMVSGGLSTELYSDLNVPDDYLPVVTEYIKQQLLFERSQPVDVQQDGVDAIRTT